ncbi:MAG: DUF1700 domain-containing protein [Lachnospira sp.]|nr:DUF1700 domain-containing protein [Lachnospira sp.]
MDKQEYMKALQDELRKKFSKDECDNIIEYYEEYFEDAGVENEAAVISELGTPNELAKKLIAGDAAFDKQVEKVENVEKVVAVLENVETDKEPEKKNDNNMIIAVLIAIVTSPIWIPAIGACIGGIITIFSFNVALYIATVALMLVGIVSIAVGIGLMFSSVGTGLLTMGIGFIVLALGIAFMLLAVTITNLIIKFIKWIFSKSKKEV